MSDNAKQFALSTLKTYLRYYQNGKWFINTEEKRYLEFEYDPRSTEFQYVI